MPKARKSRWFLVATVSPCTLAVAAILNLPYGHGGEKHLVLGKALDPINHGRIRPGTAEFRYDIGVQQVRPLLKRRRRAERMNFAGGNERLCSGAGGKQQVLKAGLGDFRQAPPLLNRHKNRCLDPSLGNDLRPFRHACGEELAEAGFGLMNLPHGVVAPCQ